MSAPLAGPLPEVDEPRADVRDARAGAHDERAGARHAGAGVGDELSRTRPARAAHHEVPAWIAAYAKRLAAGPALPVLALLGLWWIATAGELVQGSTLVSPARLLERFVALWQKGYQGVPFVQQVLASMFRTLAGFALAALIGTPLGLLMGMSRPVRWLLSPIFAMVRPVPAIAFIPLFVIWFGIGEFSKVLVIFLSAFLYITVNTEAAVYAIPQGWQRVALNMGASRATLFRRVIFPAALPGIITGLRIGLALSWALVVAAELIGAQRGLGFMIMDAAVFFRVEDVYVGIICIGVIGLALNGVLGMIERRVCHWRGR